MTSLSKREITGTALVLIISSAVRWSAYSFICLMLVIVVLTLLEFYRLFHSAELLPQRIPGIVLSFSLVISSLLCFTGICRWTILLINIPLAFGIFMIELYREAKNPFYNLAFTFLGIVGITLPLSFFLSIAFLPVHSGAYHWQIILGYFFILWVSDGGAFFVGTHLGRHPLFKRISPKKTWEGSAGGALLALATAFVNSVIFSELNMLGWLMVAAIIVVTGTFGDFFKSLMKRSLGIKDSGTILPGHGGMLDRFDTLLGSAPFAFSYLVLFQYA